MNKSILLSLALIGVVSGITLGITGAWWTDEATSSNTSFHSGTMDLKLANANANGDPTGGWLDHVTQTWDYYNMVPGGNSQGGPLWLKNVGSTPADWLKFTAKTTPTPSGLDKVMRITKLEYAGESLLTGGAGAVIPDYEAPISCDINVQGDYSTIRAAIVAATTGQTICVQPGNYSTTWEGDVINVDEEVTIVSTDGPSSTTISAGITVASDNVTIEGFTISKAGVTSGAYDHLTIKNNIVTDINSNNGTVYGIVIAPGNTSISDIVIENNQINDLHYTGALPSGFSVAGIAVGWSTETAVISNVQIHNNIISNITSNTSAWPIGKGAHGMLINYGSSAAGYVTGLSITHNTVTDLEGLWSHGIGLETNTHNTSVTSNDISDLVDHKFPSDAIAVFLEDNPNGGTVVVNKNNFGSDVSWGVAMWNSAGTVDATNNWWGDFDPSDQVFGNVDYSSYAGGPFIGYINGSDYNSNHFADLNDFYGVTSPSYANDPILVENPQLGSQQKLELEVQLDGPTSNNTHINGSVSLDVTATMGQGPVQ